MTQVILGGGISGLAAAHYLKIAHPHCRIIILEGTDHLGGWIRSKSCDDGTLLEAGPRTLRLVLGIIS